MRGRWGNIEKNSLKGATAYGHMLNLKGKRVSDVSYGRVNCVLPYMSSGEGQATRIKKARMY